MQVGFRPTGRTCSQPGCLGKLRDFVLDWESALPEEQLQETQRQVAAADLVLCLGTSLQIVPVCNLPFKPAKAGGLHCYGDMPASEPRIWARPGAVLCALCSLAAAPLACSKGAGEDTSCSTEW